MHTNIVCLGIHVCDITIAFDVKLRSLLHHDVPQRLPSFSRFWSLHLFRSCSTSQLVLRLVEPASERSRVVGRRAHAPLICPCSTNIVPHRCPSRFVGRCMSTAPQRAMRQVKGGELRMTHEWFGVILFWGLCVSLKCYMGKIKPWILAWGWQNFEDMEQIGNL